MQCKNGTNNLVDDAKEIVGNCFNNGNNAAYINKNDDLFVCGYNASYNLGDGTVSQSTRFKKVMIKDIRTGVEEKIKQVVVCGGYEKGAGYLVLTQTGKLYSWGPNYSGQSGFGTLTPTEVPTIVNTLKDKVIEKIYSSSTYGTNTSYGCIDKDGNVYMCGYNVPSAENSFKFGKYTKKFAQISIPEDCLDMVIVGNRETSVGAIFLTIILQDNPTKM
jgi:alpha-tubulin suppressor-like RCC1 family protein